MLLQLDLID